MTHRRLFVALAASAIAAIAAGSLPAQTGADHPGAGHGVLPSGWHVQTDWSARRNAAAPAGDVRVSASGDAHEVRPGPAAIFWREADTAAGRYQVAASLSQNRNPEHPEAYGIFVGGRDLAGEGQAYTYLLVRPWDRAFSIRRRTGRRARPTALVEWSVHDAVARADPASGRATNRLAILVGEGDVRFLINDVEVHRAHAADVDAAGIAGYRVNHNLDVRLGPLRITAGDRRGES
jgi:hypothetical protein